MDAVYREILEMKSIFLFPTYPHIIEKQMNHVGKMLTIKFDTNWFVTIDDDIGNRSENKHMDA